MKTISKILLMLMVMIAVTVIMPRTSVMAKSTPYKAGDGGGGASKQEGEKIELMDGVEVGEEFGGSTNEATTGLRSVVNKLLGFLQIASALIAVVMIAVTGFRYIIETPEMKNELKKSMIPIIVGILLVFFATSIAKFFVGMFGK